MLYYWNFMKIINSKQQSISGLSKSTTPLVICLPVYIHHSYLVDLYKSVFSFVKLQKKKNLLFAWLCRTYWNLCYSLAKRGWPTKQGISINLADLDGTHACTLVVMWNNCIIVLHKLQKYQNKFFFIPMKFVCITR